MSHFTGRAAACAAAVLFSTTLGAPAFAAKTHVRAAAAKAAAATPQVPQFALRTFARGNAALFTPDGIVVTKHYVFVDYQNASDTTPTPSTIAKYTRYGKLLGTVNIDGRCDGLRLNPVTHKLWALVNNDGLNGSPPRQPGLFVIDTRTLQKTFYHFSTATQLHGGGFDDIAFIKGRAFLSAASPTLTAAGVNDKPIAYEARLTANSVVVKPIAYGNTSGLDIVSGKIQQLNIADPDSLAVDSQQDLVVVSEGDAQIVVIRNPGDPSQSISRLASGTQLDDVAATKRTYGSLYIADSTLNVIYVAQARFPRGTIFAEAPIGAPVSSFVGTLDPTTGILTPLLTVRDGIVDPTALIFVATEEEDDD